MESSVIRTKDLGAGERGRRAHHHHHDGGRVLPAGFADGKAVCVYRQQLNFAAGLIFAADPRNAGIVAAPGKPRTARLQPLSLILFGTARAAMLAG